MKTVLNLVLAAMLACSSLPPFTTAAEKGQVAPPPPPGVKPLNAPGLHNLFALGTNVLSGSSPDGEEGFAALAKLGVKTIITVDGAKPDLELAHKYGMRYAHIPHGYDGISTNVQAQLTKAAQTVPGPIYIHCHHGIHRSPAAAAVICMANNGWTAEQGEAWLKTAGTGNNYVGLFQTVREFRPPTTEQLSAIPGEFPETAKVSGLVDMMVEIDERWDHLKSVRRAGYQVPNEHPDILPAHEAVILWEHYREAQRLAESTSHGDKFIELLKSAESGAKEAEQLLRQFATEPKPEIRAQLDKSFNALAQNCSSCHKSYRDAAGIKARK